MPARAFFTSPRQGAFSHRVKRGFHHEAAWPNLNKLAGESGENIGYADVMRKNLTALTHGQVLLFRWLGYFD